MVVDGAAITRAEQIGQKLWGLHTMNHNRSYFSKNRDPTSGLRRLRCNRLLPSKDIEVPYDSGQETHSEDLINGKVPEPRCFPERRQSQIHSNE